MSDSSAPAPEPQPETATPAPARPKPMVMIGVIVLALGAGAGGGFVLAPRLLPKTAATGADSAAAHAEEGESSHEKGGKASGGKIFRIDNLIVNPAGSEGSRFLMASVAFEVATDEAEQALKDHDVQLRDLVVSTLESQTMQRLTQPFARDSLKRQLVQVVATVIGPKARVAVYLPQFVIQ